jgi:hypothetical protein
MYSKQVTSGEIVWICPRPDYIQLTVRTMTQDGTFLTYLRLGLTNYKLRNGDTVAWSAAFGGVRSNVAWWSPRANEVHFPCKLWLEDIETQQRLS